MTPLQQAAARYARAGYPVIAVWGLHGGKTCRCPKGAACTTPGKHPIDNNWPTRATADPARAAALFTQRPQAHIGIMPPAGHVIVDVDPRNGGRETLKTLLNGHKLPATPIQRSGGGGIHIVLAGSIPAPLGKGIDVKRPGRGYVVAEPAEHISGGKYTWRTAPWQHAPAPVPQAWRVKALPQQHHADPIPTAVPLARVREALVHVNADDYARWVNIGQALKYNYGDDGHEVWVDWSKTSSKYKDGDETKWDSFDRNRDRALITVRSIMAVARRSGYRPLATEFARSLWALGDVSDLLSAEAAPIDWVLEPCIPAGKVTLLAGAGGSSKSYLAMTLAMQLAVEQELGPFKPGAAHGKALLLVAEENRADVHRRLRAILKARMYTDEQVEQIAQRMGVVSVRGHDWRLVYHDEAGDIQETERVDYLIDELVGLSDVRLLVLDPLVAFNGANENDNMEMARFMFALDRVAERTGAAVVVLHHVSKGGQVTTLQDATQAVVRGASALVDNARAALLLTRMPRADAPLYNLTAEQAGRFVVARVVKNNYGPHVPDVIFAVEAGGALRLAPEVQRQHRTPAAAARAMEQQTTPAAVLRALRAQPRAAQGALAQAAGIGQQRVSQVLQQLLEAGHVRRLGVGRNTTYELTPAGQRELGEEENNDDIF